MKKVFTMFFLIIVIALAALLWTLNHYVLWTNKGIIVLDKRFVTFTDTFKDTRSWSAKDFDLHPEIKKSMILQGYSDILIELKTREIKAELLKIYDNIEQSAETIQKEIEDWLGFFKSEPNNCEPNLFFKGNM